MLTFLTLSGSLLALYLAGVAVAYYKQEVLILSPEPLSEDHAFDFEIPFEEVYVRVRPGVKIHALWFRHAKKNQVSKGCIMYHRGKTGNLSEWAETYRDFIHHGYDFFIYDYRGVGKSKGRLLRERSLHRDALACFAFLRKHYAKNRIIQFGRSFGTGVAINLARKVSPPLLILETPYLSMMEMATLTVPYLPHRFILKYPIPSYTYIHKVKTPILMIHGTEDEVVPYAHSLELQKLNQRAKLVTIEGGMHNGLNEYPQYHEAIEKALLDCELKL